MSRFRLVRLVPLLTALRRSTRKADVPYTWGWGRVTDVPYFWWVVLVACGRSAVMRDGLTVLVRGSRASGESDHDQGRYRRGDEDRPDADTASTRMGNDLCVHRFPASFSVG
jgi:hypothetical protein